MIDINLNKISKRYGTNVVLNNIDLTINKGEKIALIGSNGCGKSTLLKIIIKEENVDGGDVAIRKDATLGYLSQIPKSSNGTVKEYIYDAFKDILILKEKLEKLESNLTDDVSVINKYMKLQEKFINLGGYEYETKIKKILFAFDISDQMLIRDFNTLSGGEKTICSLVKLLLIEPDILLLDEPTNHLDIKRISWLENYLNSYNGTVLIVSHDRYFLDKVTNKTILLTKIGIEIYFGNYSYFIDENEKRVELELKKYKDNQKKIEAMKKSIKRLQEFGRLCSPSGGEIFFRRAASMMKRLEKMEKIDKPEMKKQLNIDFSSNERSGSDVLKISNLMLGFKDKILLDKANLDVLFRERICLVGDNGTGKSTLIKEILKENNPCIKSGSNIKLGYIPQEIIFENEELSVLEEARKHFVGYDEYLRATLFKFLFVGDNIHKKIKYLSGGERVRLKLFCLTQSKYNFLILDEVTNHIDIDTREMLEEALNSFNGTILFISHDRYFINKIATHIVELKDKKLYKYIGNYDKYLN